MLARLSCLLEEEEEAWSRVDEDEDKDVEWEDVFLLLEEPLFLSLSLDFLSGLGSDLFSDLDFEDEVLPLEVERLGST